MAIIQLNARAADDSVLPAIVVSSVTPSSRWVILVHGYNNDRAAAQSFYDQFVANTGLDDGKSVIGEVSWPGDKHWGPASFASFPLELAPAHETAQVLEAFVAGLPVPGPWPLQVMLVCHSLGNRVCLEMVNLTVSNQMRPQIDYYLCSMAAAVPVALVQAGEPLALAANRLSGHVIMYSRGDSVLHFGFPIGETLAGEGFFPAAIGRRGEPAPLWGAFGEREMINAKGKKYGHGDYWSGAESAALADTFLRGIPVPKIIGRTTEEMDISDRTTPTAEIGTRTSPRRASF